MSLPSISLPKYELELPFSKKKINFRPFVVREEKLLLLAIQEGENKKISQSVKTVLSDCAFGLDINSLAQIDLEYLFLQIRNKSMGEGIEAVSTCVHCDKKNFMTLDLSKTQVKMPEKEINDTIQLSPDVWIKMRLPNIDESYEMVDMNPEEVITIMAKCVVTIIKGEELIDPKNFSLVEMVDWLENLTEEPFTKIVDFMQNVPVLLFEQDYKCVHCGENNLVRLEGMESFFD